ncbi:MAG: ester cyclase [Acidobacteria bacterium]|nr:ester cyclase [Acidobacteriota bacterium]
MTREEILALLDERQAAYERRDPQGLARLHAENGVVESLMAGTVRGRAAIGEVYKAWLAAFPDLAVTRDELVIDGEQVVEVVTHAGTDRGGFMGMPPTGKPFRLPIVHVYRMQDGRIAHERRIYDFTGLLVQIGVLKARPA